MPQVDTREFLNQRQKREFSLEHRSIDEEKREFEMSFASAEPYMRWWGREILDMDNLDLSYFQQVGAVLYNHDMDRLIGNATKIRVDGDKVARCTTRISTADDCKDHWTKIKEGILKSTSVGYEITKATLLEEDENGVCTYLCGAKVYEASMVSMGADPKVGVDKSLPNPSKETKNMPEPLPTTPPAPVPVLTPEAMRRAEIAEIGEMVGESELAKDFILNGRSADDFRKEALERRQAKQKPVSTLTVPSDSPQTEFTRYSSVRNFKGKDAERKAYRLGRWFMATLGQSEKFKNLLAVQRSIEFCRANNLVLRVNNSEGVNEDGGFLVPHEFGNDLIDLREEFGVFRRNAKIEPMMSDTKSVPRRTGGLTAYFANEASALTASKAGWDRVQLVAKKLIALAKITSELSEDALISMGDYLAGEIAYAFAVKEDDCGFNGDGTSTYGGITGVREKLKGLNGTIANIAGLVVASGTGYGTSYGSVVLSDFNKVKGRLPQYAFTRGTPKWYVHQSFWSEVMEKLILAAGGVTAEQLQMMVQPRFLGYPVEICQTFPKDSAVSQVCALFGSLSLAASFGERRMTTITLSEHSSFDTDEIDIRGTSRFDIVVHDVGNASGTASARVAGPVVGLITASS